MHECMHAYIQTHIHTYIHTYTQTHEHTYIHTYIHAHVARHPRVAIYFAARCQIVRGVMLPQQRMAQMVMMQRPADCHDAAAGAGAGLAATGGRAPRGQSSPEASVSPITTAGIAIAKLPRVRLAEAVESMCPEFDSMLTGALDQRMLCIVIWMLTGVNCNLTVQDLRCASYAELYERSDSQQTVRSPATRHYTNRSNKDCLNVVSTQTM